MVSEVAAPHRRQSEITTRHACGDLSPFSRHGANGLSSSAVAPSAAAATAGYLPMLAAASSEPLQPGPPMLTGVNKSRDFKHHVTMGSKREA